RRRLQILVAALEKGARSLDPGLVLKTGSTLVRQWRGRTHTVLVSENGFEYGGHARDGYFPNLPYPVVCGHEGAGIIEQVGAAVTDLAPGDPVVISFPWCGECGPCRAARISYCEKARPLKSSGRRVDGSIPMSRNGEPVYSCFFQQSSFANFALAPANATPGAAAASSRGRRRRCRNRCAAIPPIEPAAGSRVARRCQRGSCRSSRSPRQRFSIGRSSAPALGGRRSYPNSRPLPGSAGLAVVSLLHFAEHLVQVEAGGFLALRVLPEGLQKFPDKGLRRHQQEDVINKPIIVGDRCNVGPLKRDGAKIEQLRYAKRDKRVRPDPHRARLSLFGEHYLPMVVAQCHELLVVIDV